MSKGKKVLEKGFTTSKAVLLPPPLLSSSLPLPDRGTIPVPDRRLVRYKIRTVHVIQMSAIRTRKNRDAFDSRIRFGY